MYDVELLLCAAAFHADRVDDLVSARLDLWIQAKRAAQVQ
jgi:hypothetical protein